MNIVYFSLSELNNAFSGTTTKSIETSLLVKYVYAPLPHSHTHTVTVASVALVMTTLLLLVYCSLLLQLRVEVSCLILVLCYRYMCLSSLTFILLRRACRTLAVKGMGGSRKCHKGERRFFPSHQRSSKKAT